MKAVQPIRDTRVIEGIREYLKITSERDYLFFCLGIYSGLRVSDLLNLRVGMVRGTHVTIKEAKTGKTKKFILHPIFKDDLKVYIAAKRDDEFLFPSRQKKRKSGIKSRPIDRSTAYKMLNKVAIRFGLSEIGCHTLRKTWGYHLYRQDRINLAFLMLMFNHSRESVTLLYLGITQEAMDAATLRMS
jgi:integrase